MKKTLYLIIFFPALLMGNSLVHYYLVYTTATAQSTINLAKFQGYKSSESVYSFEKTSYLLMPNTYYGILTVVPKNKGEKTVLDNMASSGCMKLIQTNNFENPNEGPISIIYDKFPLNMYRNVWWVGNSTP